MSEEQARTLEKGIDEYEKENKRLRYIIYVYSNFLNDMGNILEIVDSLPYSQKQKFNNIIDGSGRGVCPHCCKDGEHDFEILEDPNGAGEGVYCKICGYTIFGRLECQIPY